MLKVVGQLVEYVLIFFIVVWSFVVEALVYLGDFVPRWSKLRRIGEARLIGFTVLVPIAGSLILFNDRLIDLFLVAEDVVARLGIERESGSVSVERAFTISRLFYIYFGFSFVGVASLLFKVGCPEIISRHESDAEYANALVPHFTNAKRKQMYEGMVDRRLVLKVVYPARYRQILNCMERNKKGKDVDIDSDLKSNLFCSQDDIKDWLFIEYELKDASKPLSRALVSVLYAFGFLVLIKPAWDTFIKVFNVFYELYIRHGFGF